jgi:dUTP pyrophosphatase
MQNLFWAKLKESAIIPTKRPEDAGYDIYANFDEESITIQPHETKMIPTGIASAFPQGYVCILKERGSTGSKGIGQRCGVVDSGYRGEYFVAVTNHNDKPLVITKTPDKHNADNEVIYPYSKAICQAILVAIPEFESKEIAYAELQEIKSERGTGKIGSSNK